MSCSTATAPRPRSCGSTRPSRSRPTSCTSSSRSTTGRGRREQDLVSVDHYLRAELDGAALRDRQVVAEPPDPLAAPHDLAMSADLTRSLAGGSPWLVMEHSTSAVNWQPQNLAKTPGPTAARQPRPRRTRRRRCAVLPVARLPGRRREVPLGHGARTPAPTAGLWRDVVELGRQIGCTERGRREPGAGQGGRDAFDWNGWWGLELDSHPSVEVDLMSRVRAWHGPSGKGVHRRLRAPGPGPGRLRPAARAHVYLVSDDASANPAGWSGRHRGDLVLRDRRCPRPGQTRRLSRSVHRPAGPAGGGVLAAARRRAGRAPGSGRQRTPAGWAYDVGRNGLDRADRHPRGRCRGARHVRNRDLSGAAGDHPPRSAVHPCIWAGRVGLLPRYRTPTTSCSGACSPTPLPLRVSGRPWSSPAGRRAWMPRSGRTITEISVRDQLGAGRRVDPVGGNRSVDRPAVGGRRLPGPRPGGGAGGGGVAAVTMRPMTPVLMTPSWSRVDAGLRHGEGTGRAGYPTA